MPKSKDDYISFVEERIKLAEDWTMKRQIMINVNYYVGNQWIAWNRGEKRIIEAPRLPNEERITVNKIRPRVNTLLAKHTRNRLKFDVVAATKEQEDIDAAVAADRYLDYLWEHLDMSDVTRDIFLNGIVKGWCAVKTWFDASAGPDITPEDSEEPVHQGEIRVRVCDPLTIYVDPSATTEREIRWIAEVSARDVDELEEEYGEKVTPDENLEYLGNYDSLQVASDGLTTNVKRKNKNMALVKELWVKPCAKYPNGLKVTVAGGKVLDVDENAGELPYQIFGYVPVPGTVRYESIVKDMTAAQREINILHSMMATHAKKLGNAMWLVPMGSGVDEDELSDEIGGIVHYNPQYNMKPERAQSPDIPGFYDRYFEKLLMDMDDSSGAREITQGRLPAGLDTASGLALMVEQENEKLVVASSNYENGMKNVLTRMLRLLKKHYTEERQARIIGDDHEIEIISFNGSDLTGNEDIKIVQGSSLPEMKAAQEDRIMTLWNAGAIVTKDGQPDHGTFLRLMGMGDSTELFEMTQLDENRAKMENKMFEDMTADGEILAIMLEYVITKQTAEAINDEMQRQAEANGIPPEQLSNLMQDVPPPPPGYPRVREFQDHAVHLYHHNIFRKSSAYDELPEEVQAMVDAHVEEHEKMLQAPMEQQQQAEQEAQRAQQEQQQAMQAQELSMKERKLQIEELNAMTKASQLAQKVRVNNGVNIP